MALNTKQWSQLLRFCLGIVIGSAFCMKWMEPDFTSSGHPFTIIGLEISYPAEKLKSILSGLDEQVKTILRYHLTFDFIFMAGVYPGIAAISMIGRGKLTGTFFRSLLLSVALLQLLGWACDIFENYCLLNWIRNPGNVDTGIYHIVVSAKWIIAIGGLILSIPLALKRKK
jgi:hypothetical protein